MFHVSHTWVLPIQFDFDTVISHETTLALDYWYPSYELNTDIYPNIYWAVNTITIILTIPVVNFLFIPCFPKLTIRARIGIGLVLYTVASVVLMIIHGIPLASEGQHSIVSRAQLVCLLIPASIVALAEVFTVISGKYT